MAESPPSPLSEPRFCIRAQPGKRRGLLYLARPAAHLASSQDINFPGDLIQSSARDLYHDLNFNFVFDDSFPQGARPKAPSTATTPGTGATKLCRTHGFHLAWSAAIPPPDGTQQTSQPSASTLDPSTIRLPHAISLSDPEPTQALEEMLSLLDDFFEAAPESERALGTTNPVPLPGRFQGSEINEIDTESKEPWFNICFAKQHMPLVNEILSLCHRAVQWAEAQQTVQQGGEVHRTSWPVPLDAPLVLKSEPPSKARTDQTDTSTAAHPTREEQTAASGDFWLYHKQDLLGIIESKPNMTYEKAKKWTEPRADPLKPINRVPAVPSSARSPSSLPPKKNKREQDGYAIAEWYQKLTLQAVTQLYLHNVTSGVLLGDWGRILIFYELHPLQATGSDDPSESVPSGANPSATRKGLHGMSTRSLKQQRHGKKNKSQTSDYVLCFAVRSIYTFVPELGALAGSLQDPESTIIQYEEAYMRDLATASSSAYPTASLRGVPTHASVSFTSRPGTIWALVHWALCLSRSRRLRPRIVEPSQNEAVLKGVIATDVSKATEHSRSGHSGRPKPARPSPDGGSSYKSPASGTRRAGEVPTITAIFFVPAPYAFGTYANIYRAVNRTSKQTSQGNIKREGKDFKEKWGASITIAEWRQAKTFLKIHRQPTEDEEWEERRCAPSLLCWDDQSIASIQSRTEIEVAAYQRLKPLQGTAIPKLLGLVPSHLPPESHSCKLLVEAVGTSLAQLFTEQASLCSLWRQELYRGTLKAIGSCHSLGVVHGDLHLGNIVAEWSSGKQTVSPDHVLSLTQIARQKVKTQGSTATETVHTVWHDITKPDPPSTRGSDSSDSERASSWSSSVSSSEALCASSIATPSESISSSRPSSNKACDAPLGLQELTGLRLRISIIDWSEAAFDAAEEEPDQQKRAVGKWFAELVTQANDGDYERR
ncbi:unnamed protein product [Sympodiomycopsis kandeliae]